MAEAATFGQSKRHRHTRLQVGYYSGAPIIHLQRIGVLVLPVSCSPTQAIPCSLLLTLLLPPETSHPTGHRDQTSVYTLLDLPEEQYSVMRAHMQKVVYLTIMMVKCICATCAFNSLCG